MRCRKPPTAPLHRSSLPFFSLSTDCNKKYSCEESLVALLSVYPLSAPLLPLVESASAATSAATEGRKLLPLQPFSPWSHRRAPQSQSLWVHYGCKWMCVCNYVLKCMFVCVCVWLCAMNVFVCLCERVSLSRMPSVMLQRVGLNGRCWVIQSVCVMCGLASQRARVGQRSCSTVTEKPKGTDTTNKWKKKISYTNICVC